MTKLIDVPALAVVEAVVSDPEHHSFGEYLPLQHVCIRGGRVYGADGFMLARAELIDPDDYGATIPTAATEIEDGTMLRAKTVGEIRRCAAAQSPGRLTAPGVAWIAGDCTHWELRHVKDMIISDELAKPADFADSVHKEYPGPDRTDDLFADRTVAASIVVNPQMMLRAFAAVCAFTKEYLGEPQCSLHLVTNQTDKNKLDLVLVAERDDKRRIEVMVMPMACTPLPISRTATFACESCGQSVTVETDSFEAEVKRCQACADQVQIHFAPKGQHFVGGVLVADAPS